MAAPGRVELTVLGQTLVVRTEAPEDYMRSLAAYVEERAGSLRSAGVRDPATALALAALDITDELFRARAERAEDEGALNTRLGALVTLLEQAAPGPSPSQSP